MRSSWWPGRSAATWTTTRTSRSIWPLSKSLKRLRPRQDAVTEISERPQWLFDVEINEPRRQRWSSTAPLSPATSHASSPRPQTPGVGRSPVVLEPAACNPWCPGPTAQGMVGSVIHSER